MTSENPERRNGEPISENLLDIRSAGERQAVVLLADAEAQIRNMVGLLLKQDGYLVLLAADGRQGLSVSRQYSGPIDLLITDFNMPRLNGTDLCAHLLEERPGIKVLVMSGAYPAEIARQNANVPFLAKPFDGPTLKARVREILATPLTCRRVRQAQTRPIRILRFKFMLGGPS
jgi:DNA-binding response OmpR family regulator